MKNDLKTREDIKGIIMRPIWQRFGLRKPKVEIDEAAEECQKAFDIVCSFIGTRDLVQEHIAFRVWPLVEKWEMPKETISKSDEGGLVRLKYTFIYEGKFIEPDDDWLKCIKATSDELLGPYYFSCYGFIARPNASHPVPTFRKRWPGDLMKEWFYVKNDLKAREDIKDIIMRPIWQRFGLRKPKVEIDEAAEECQKAFGIVCCFIRTRDLVQEHIAFRVWPLVEQWEMPKETISKPDEGGLVRLKYTFRYKGKFIEPDDDWLKCIEATSDELLGPYSKTEDNTLSATFGGRKKKRLNRVFDAIGFMYPDYRYPLKGQKRKSATSGKGDTSVALSEAL